MKQAATLSRSPVMRWWLLSLYKFEHPPAFGAAKLTNCERSGTVTEWRFFTFDIKAH